MVIIFALFFCFFQNLRSYCFKGCLKCTTNDICLYCDTSQGYQLQYGACIIKEEDQNCLEKSKSNTCLNCKQGYVLDLNYECIQLPIIKTIQNCYLYQDEQCVQCKKGYYQVNYNCKPIDIQIENCLTYQQKDQCNKCEEGYYVSYSGKECLPIQQKQNCFGYTYLNCNKCRNGYLFNENFFVTELQNDSSYNVQKINKIVQDYTSENNHIHDPNFCQQIIVQNCFQYRNNYECIECKEGYYLDSNFQCKIFPKQVIKNCEIYANDDICKKCTNDYFTIDGKICQEIPKIKNCIKYDQRKEYLNCIQCQEDYYIDENNENICQLRIDSHQDQIQFCNIKNSNSDTCKQCIDNYILSEDSLKCMQSISNCQKHYEYYYNAEQLFCKTCQPYYYIQENFCVKGTIQNCEIYHTSENKCKQCENQYYLDQDQQCKSHKKLQNCSIYSNSQKDVCEFCNNENFNFVVQQYCVNLNKIQYCQEYNNNLIYSSNEQLLSKSICVRCQNGFYLQNNQCHKIKVNNCMIFDIKNQYCQQCDNGFFLLLYHDSNNTLQKRCEPYQEYIADGCEEFEINQQNKNTNCKICKNNHLPFDVNGYFVCINQQVIDYDVYQIENYDKNCLKYKLGKCVMCEKNYFLHPDNDVCMLNSCSNNYNQQHTYTPIIYSVINDHYQIEKINKCLQDMEFIYIQSLNYFEINLDQIQNSNYISIKCKKNTLDVVQLDLTDRGYSLYNMQGQFRSLKNKQPQVACPNTNDIQFINNIQYDKLEQDFLIQNCEFYINYQQFKFGCIKCKNGYKGYIKQSKQSFLDECLIDNECFISQQLQNLDVYWQKLVSCYACQDQNMIPYLIYNGKQLENPEFDYFQAISLKNQKWEYFEGQEKLGNMECLPKYAEDLSYTLGLKNVNQVELIQNCAIGFLNTKYNKDEFNSLNIQNKDEFVDQQAILCIACKPGYYSLEHKLNHLYKIQCVKIENCVQYGGEWLNSCSQCQEGYAYGYEQQKYNFEKCVQSNVDNCYAFDLEAQKCIQCIKGYFLDEKNYCIQLSISNCETEYNHFIQNIQTQDLNVLTYFHQFGYGCIKCKSNYTSIYINNNIEQTNICVIDKFTPLFIDEIIEDNFRNTIYIPYCKQYFNTIQTEREKLKCQTCAKEYVVTETRDKCLDKNSFKNCLIVQEKSQKCISCEPQYHLINGQCEHIMLRKCEVYNTNISENRPICISCKDGYYINQTLDGCNQGYVNNCQRYGKSQYECIQCYDNFHLIQIGSDENIKSYCYPLNFDFQCEEAQISSSFYGASFYCTKCKNNYGALVKNEKLQTQCLSFYVIENCQEYDVKQQFQQSSFSCKICIEGYYVGNFGNNCYLRKNIIKNCLKYKQDADACEICNNKYYLNIESNKCMDYPSGIPHCTYYKDLQTCIQCEKNMYLQNNKCNLVPSNYLIRNCTQYLDINICQKCQDRYFLYNNKCFETKIENCVIPQSFNDCQKCQQGYAIAIINQNKKQCLEIPISNCLIYNFKLDKCQQCSIGFYNNNIGDCVIVAKSIQNCEYYQDEEKCEKCYYGYVLTSDKKSCHSVEFIQNNNCDDLQIKNNLSCSLCQSGFFLQDGDCVSKQNSKQEYSQNILEGCLLSDFQQKEVCLLCKPDYYMRSNQQCVKIIKQRERIFVFEYFELLSIKIFLLVLLMQLISQSKFFYKLLKFLKIQFLTFVVYSKQIITFFLIMQNKISLYFVILFLNIFSFCLCRSHTSQEKYQSLLEKTLSSKTGLIEIDDQQAKSYLLQHPRNYDLLIFFSTKECQMCHDVDMYFRKISQAYKDNKMYLPRKHRGQENFKRPIMVMKINLTFQDHEITNKYQIRTLPTFLYSQMEEIYIEDQYKRKQYLDINMWRLSSYDGIMDQSSNRI